MGTSCTTGLKLGGKMDEKIGEIKDCLSKILYDEKDYGGKHLLKDETAWLAYYKLVKNSELWLRHLLSCIKKLGEGIEKYLDDPEFDTDILTKLIEKEK